MDRIEVLRGDITRLDVDGIVNAANEGLLGGGGVDGAIHRAAGSQLIQACRDIPIVSGRVRCPTGSVRITPGFELRARFVLHTAGPIWHGGQRGEEEQLRSCYESSLQAAVWLGIRTLAFPAISCGVYGYPIDAAAEVAVRTTQAFLAKHPTIEKVIFVAFDEPVAAALQRQTSKPERNSLF